MSKPEAPQHVVVKGSSTNKPITTLISGVFSPPRHMSLSARLHLLKKLFIHRRLLMRLDGNRRVVKQSSVVVRRRDVSSLSSESRERSLPQPEVMTRKTHGRTQASLIWNLLESLWETDWWTEWCWAGADADEQEMIQLSVNFFHMQPHLKRLLPIWTLLSATASNKICMFWASAIL